MMNLDFIKQYLYPEEIQRLFHYWSSLDTQAQEEFLNQIKSLNVDLLKRQRQLVQMQAPDALKLPIEPFFDFEYAGHQKDQERGKELIRNGRLGCLVLAGGQGSRLHFPYPKGMYPISVIKDKSLFQLISEKVLAAGNQIGKRLYIAIMTSPLNDAITKDFFKKNHFFGLQADQIDFFTQGMLPFLDDQGYLFLESKEQIAMGPNGNGLCLEEFVKAGIWSKWHEKGIRYIHTVPVDNPLADPFDAELLGFHDRRQVDVSSKSVEKKNPDEKVGVFVKQGGKPAVIEYSELTEAYKKEREREGHLLYRCASLSLFCFSMDFIKEISEKAQMPLHKSWKAASYLDASGQVQHSKQPNAWKFETFIFDVLKYTQRVAALIYPREQVFAPLKNAEGVDSPLTVRKALQERDRQVLQQITDSEVHSNAFELAADFYYPTSDLINSWKTKKDLMIQGYIGPNS